MTPRLKATLFAFLALLALVPLLLFTGEKYTSMLVSEVRSNTQIELHLYSSSIEKSIGRLLDKLESLSAFVQTQRHSGRKLNREDFEIFAAGLHASAKWIRAFQIVVDGVIEYTYPVKGNEAVVGYDLLADKRPVIGGDVYRAFRRGTTTITGPIELVQGDQGIIIRKPLSKSAGAKGTLVAVVLNIAPLLQESGIPTSEGHVDLAIRIDEGAVFFGSRGVFDSSPVVDLIELPDGAWEVGGIPFDGWDKALATQLEIFYGSGALILVLIGLLVYAVSYRQGRLEHAVQDRTDDLSNANALLEEDIAMRMEVEKALRKSEANFRNAIEQASDGILIAGQNGHFVDVNTAAFVMLGYSRNELLGMNITDLVSRASLASEPVRMQELLEGKTVITERPLVKKDGTILPVEISAKMLPDGRLMGIVRDISERQKALARIHDSEEQYRTLAETATDAIITIDENSTILYVNAAIKNVFGYARTELLQKSMTMLMPDYLRAIHEASLERYVATGRRHGTWDSVELTGLHRNGKEIPLEVSFGEFRKAGQYLFTGIVRDITARKKAEEALQSSEKHYRTLLEQSPVGIQVFEPDGTLVLVNKAWEDIWGTSADAVVGRYNALNDPQLTSLGLQEHTTRVFKGEEVNFPDILFDPAASGMPGEKKWVRPKAFHVTVEGDQISHIVMLSEDITLSKEAQNEVLKLNEELEKRVKQRTRELEESNKELEAFSYSVSHDLRSPLRIIQGYSSILDEDYGKKLDSEGRRIISVIKRNTSRMGTLIDELLTLSRLGRIDLNPSETDMESLAREALREALLGSDTNKDVQITIEDVAPVRCDQSLMTQVWMNLLSNAVKFTSTRKEPSIAINSVQRDGERIYSVADNGVGFDMKYAHQVFEVFQRLHRSTEFPGTGVGLAIVQRIIQRHGGRIWAESQEGEGATFFFAIPIKGDQHRPSS